MNLEAGFKNKNIHIGNNDNEEKAQLDEEVNEDNTDYEDDEPDFMDNSGKCWEFDCKIRDEKHLKKWCQKMGGMIVGKEEKLTRQFNCKIKECQFKAIFLKSCSIVYTRNKHNHEMENGKNNPLKREEKIASNDFSSLLRYESTKKALDKITVKTNELMLSTLEKDYVDHLGKSWAFHANIGKNISHEIFRNKFELSGISEYPNIIHLRCQKMNPAGGRCHFVGIYLKSNGNFYTRGEHEHTKRTKIPQNKGEDYVDHRGNVWHFHSKIGKHDIRNGILLSKFGFSTLHRKQNLYLHCQKGKTTGRKCSIKGIYLNANGCLYTRGKHVGHK